MTFFYRTSVFKSYVKNAKALLERWRKEKKRFLIHGAGIHSLELLKHVKPDPGLFLGFIDQSVSKQQKGVLHLPVYSLQQAISLNVEGILISSYEYQESIKKEICKLSPDGIEIASLYPQTVRNGSFYSYNNTVRLQKKRKAPKGRTIAVVDSMFSWPPSGGSSVDIAAVMNRLVQSGFDVTFFLPVVEDALYFPRGRIGIQEGIAFDIVQIPFTSSRLNLKNFIGDIAAAVEDYNPEFLFLGDMGAIKPILAERLKQYKTIWRFYAYNHICPKFDLLDNKGKNCPSSFFADPDRCKKCITRDKTINWDQPIFREILLADIFSKEYRSLLVRNLEKAAHLIVYNDITKERINASFPHLNTIRIIPTGIDPNRFTRNKIEEKNEITILFPGRVQDPAKGFEFFLNVFRRVKKTLPQVRLITTGKLDINENGVENKGWISQEHLPEIYCRSDICVIPSLWEEAFGIVALEAMASGLPVVAHSAGGLRHIVRHNSTGFLIPMGNLDMFTEAVMRLAVDKNLRKKMGKEGKAKVEKYSWDKIMKRYRAVFEY